MNSMTVMLIETPAPPPQSDLSGFKPRKAEEGSEVVSEINFLAILEVKS